MRPPEIFGAAMRSAVDRAWQAYYPFLEQVLTPGRLRHSLAVMQMMDELAGIYYLDREKAVTAGLLHDAGKDLSSVEIEQILEEAGIEISSEIERDYVLYLHGPVGACFVRRELGITDPEIIDAIWMHTYCGEGDYLTSPLVWCMRFADILEPNRDWESIRWMREGAPRLREIVYAGRLAEAATLHTGLLIEWFDEDGKPVHPNMRRIYRELTYRGLH